MCELHEMHQLDSVLDILPVFIHVAIIYKGLLQARSCQ
jgi:hypothetical protein